MIARKRLGVFGTAVALLLSLSLGAMAYPAVDTLLVSGATEEGDTVTLWYATLEVEEDDGATLELECADDDETVEDEVQVDDLTAEDEECVLEGIEIEPSEGGVLSHGSFVSAFTQAVQESGWEGGVGCLVRWIAQSDYGKPGFELDDELELDAFPTSCKPGPDTEESDEVETEGNGNGPPPHAGPKDRGDWTPGEGPPPWAGKGD